MKILWLNQIFSCFYQNQIQMRFKYHLLKINQKMQGIIHLKLDKSLLINIKLIYLNQIIKLLGDGTFGRVLEVK